MPAVTLERAARNALAKYLSSRLPDVAVNARWPDGASAYTENGPISLIERNSPPEEIYDPQLVSWTPISESQTIGTWELASVTLSLQLDVWAKYDWTRENILRRLDEALRQGLGATLPGRNVLTSDPFRHGTLLQLSADDGWDGVYADFLFDRALTMDSPKAAQLMEFRSMRLGEAQMTRTGTAVSARMGKPTLKVLSGPCVDVSKPLPSAGLDITQVSSAGTTHSKT